MGYFLIGTGIFLAWVVVSGKSQKFISALGYQLPNTQKPFFVTGLGMPSSMPTKLPSAKPGPAPSSGTTGKMVQDSGIHMGIDPGGNVITIAKTYSQASDAERKAMNAFGRKFPGGVYG